MDDMLKQLSEEQKASWGICKAIHGQDDDWVEQWVSLGYHDPPPHLGAQQHIQMAKLAQEEAGEGLNDVYAKIAEEADVGVAVASRVLRALRSFPLAAYRISLDPRGPGGLDQIDPD